MSSNTANAAPTVSIQIWVAGRDTDQAMGRRQAIQEWMNRLPVTDVGAGFGRFFYDLWRGRIGTDPLASQGDCIADTEYHLAAQDVSATDLVALTRHITEDLENALGFPVAVEVEAVSVDEEIGAESSSSPESGREVGARIGVVLGEREHATILAALRQVARCGGFEDTVEADIATDGGKWTTMSPEEINQLGDRFNAGSVPMHNVCLSSGRGG
jgi:hypothetical protein